MQKDAPFLMKDMDALRDRILSGRISGKMSELWNLIRTSARNAPADFGWFVPFVAVVTREKQDIENARKIIFTYIDKMDPMSFCSGLQYHFWCFAFPHAKVSMYFQWLCSVGAFSAEEEEYISQRLISYQFTNFFYGMRTKPDPECVDNQTLSLCLSNTMVGYIFSQGEKPSKMAQIMFEEGKRRLPNVIGDMPISGYTGEGSSYMDCVNGAAIPLAVEVLELISGETDLLFRAFAPSGARPVSVLRMVAREFMPGGLLLPWDNYGYQFGVRSALAYGAAKTGEKLFFRVLEKECIWSYDIGIGWAYDDLVWTLCWWPETEPKDEDDGRNWFEETIGGTLVSGDGNQYLMQMWDQSGPVIPTRAHVNPNAVLFNGYRVPISADGSPMPNKPHSFQFDDTWRTVGFISINTQTRYNYGDGCCGAHSGIIIDDCEGMRAYGEYDQAKDAAYGQGAERSICADVTPIYRENFEDATEVYRKSSLQCDRFFLVEDYVRFEKPHKITSRFLLRPEAAVAEGHVKVVTPEGVTLYLKNLIDGDRIDIREVEYHPYKPDGRSQAVDFYRTGREVRRLFLAFASNRIGERQEITDVRVVGDETGGYGYEEASGLLKTSHCRVPMKLPAYMEAQLPNYRTWWYEKNVKKRKGKAYLKLPVGMWNARLFLNGEEADLGKFKISGELLGPLVELPGRFEELEELTVTLKVDVPVGHYDGGGDGTIGMTGGMWLCYPAREEVVEEAYWRDGRVYVKTGLGEYACEYRLKGQERQPEGVTGDGK